jgi:hypothetical protein
VLLRPIESFECTAWLFEQVCDRLGVKQSMGAVESRFDKALVSYGTSCRSLGQNSLVESASHAFDQSGSPGDGGSTPATTGRYGASRMLDLVMNGLRAEPSGTAALDCRQPV